MRLVSLLVVVAACADPPPAVDAGLDAPGPDAVPTTGRLTVIRHGDGLVTGGSRSWHSSPPTPSKRSPAVLALRN